jgi:hypothetical protein
LSCAELADTGKRFEASSDWGGGWEPQSFKPMNKETFMMRVAATAGMVAALCFNIISATAQGGSDRGTKQEQEACTPDVYKFCNGEIPDEKKIVACLKVNKKKLSPACRKVIADD